MITNTLMPKDIPHNGEHQTFACGELIVLEPNFYWLLLNGIVKTCTCTENGTPITLEYWGMDDLIGQPLSMVYPYQVKCLTRVDAVRLPLESTYQLTSLIQRHIQQTEEVLCILRSHKAYHRLRKILLWLSHKFGQEVGIGQMINLRLTHQELAEIVGATRVTVTKIINQLEQEGFLSRPRRNTVVIHNC